MDEVMFTAALKAMKARYRETYRRSASTVDDPGQAHDEALQEGLEAALQVYDAMATATLLRDFDVEIVDGDDEYVTVLQVKATDRDDALQRVGELHIDRLRSEHDDENLTVGRVKERT